MHGRLAFIKKYGTDPQEGVKRYSPAKCTGIEKKMVSGIPDADQISTSYIERQNLTMRMRPRRFTRLTNAFSKKLRYHMAAVALHYAYYNFCRPHQTLTKAAKGCDENGAGTAHFHAWWCPAGACGAMLLRLRWLPGSRTASGRLPTYWG